MKISVVTVVAGRHDHLRAQLVGLAGSRLTPWQHIVVAMDDAQVADVVTESGSRATVIDMPVWNGRLPVGRARNVGAQVAVDGGAELLVFLDVDCIPSPQLLAGYHAAASLPTHASSLLCGPVTYLPPRSSKWSVEALTAHTDPHPARPNPADGVVEEGEDYDLFWSLSFAASAPVWNTIGGFHEGYDGYGGEDTDFAAMARSARIGLGWVGGAHAYHQYHPVSSPPVEHLDDIVRNSILFHDRWGRWPMTGWLDEFERRGLIDRRGGGLATTAPEHHA